MATIFGTGSNETINGTGADDIIYGGPIISPVGTGNDIINAGAGNDVVFGGDGNDVINGQNGNDTLVGGAGNDTLNGGTGTDTVDYSQESGPSGVTVNLATGVATDTFGNTDTLIGVEKIVGTTQPDTFVANVSDNVNNTFDGRPSVFSGGSDTVDYSASTSALTITMVDGSGTARGAGIGTDTLISIENIKTGSGNDTFIVTNSFPSFDGGGGIDTIDFSRNGSNYHFVVNMTAGDGSAEVNASSYGFWILSIENVILGDGNDLVFANVTDGVDNVFNGGGGTDTVDYSASTNALTVNLATGKATGTGIGTDTLISIENVTTGSGNDTFVASVTGGISNVYNGGAGIDTISYAASGSALTVNLATGIASGTGIGTDTLISIENVTTGSGNDTIVANVTDGVDNTFNGGGGTDTVDYSASTNALTVNLATGKAAGTGIGTDTLISIENIKTGSSNDTFVANVTDGVNNSFDGGGGTDTVDYSASTNALTVNLTTGKATGTGIGTDTLTSIENVTTGSGNDAIVANVTDGVDNAFNAGGGTDTISYAASTNALTINLATGIASGTGIGTDTLISIENVTTGSGNDTIVANVTDGVDNVFNGGGGTDTVDYSASTNALTVNLATGKATGTGIGTDTLISIENVTTGSGNDTFVASVTGGISNVYNGGAGIDTISYAASGSALTVNLATGIASGTGIGTDTLISIENVTTGSGNDTIVANVTDGVDNTFNGGGGTDTVDYSASTNALTVNLATGKAAGTGIGTDTLISIENIKTGSSNDTFVANVTDGVNNSFDGGGGTDTVDYSASTNALTVNLTTGKATGTGIGTDTLTSIENVTTGSGNDAIVANVTDGVDNAFNAGGGTDTISYAASTNALTINLATGIASGTGIGTDTLISIENVTTGSGNDTIVANVTDGVDNVFNGGGGTDTVDYSASTNALTVNLATGKATGTGIGTDTLTSIENVTTGSGNDTIFAAAGGSKIFAGSGDDAITGQGGGDILIGGDGNDAINGGGGADILVGGAGNDALSGGTGSDTVDYSQDGGAGPVNVNLATGIATDTFGNTDTLSGVENIIGSNLDDTFVAAITGGVNNTFDGRGGNDTVDYSASSQNLMVDLSAGKATGTGIGTDTLISIEMVVTGSGNDVITASATGSTIIAGAGNDQLIGSAGNDILIGGSGVDSFVGGGGNDTVDFSQDAAAGGTFGAAVTLAQGFVRDGFNNLETVSGIENVIGTQFQDNFTGDGSANTFIGLGGNDVFQGGDGDDKLFGGDGNDIFQEGRSGGGSDGNDLIDGGAGADTLQISNDLTENVFVDLAMGIASGTTVGSDTLNSIENVSTNAGNDTILGNEVANVLFAGFGDDQLDGRGGDDQLFGYLGADTLTGGSGNDFIDGGADTDTAIYSGNFTDYKITLNPDGSFTVADIRAGAPDGTDTVVNVELFHFADGTLSSDAILNQPPVAENDVFGSPGLDLVAVAFGSNGLRVYNNDGTGHFTDSGQSLLGSGLSVAVGDVNGDGAPDIVAGAPFGSSSRIYLNDGHGTFTDSGQSLGTNSTAGVALGDLNGDGFLDLVEANDGQPDHVWFNDGTGKFTDSGQIIGSGTDTAVAIGDLNGDGHLDLVTANRSGSSHIYFNNGDGTFTDSGQVIAAGGSQAAVLADLNKDGALDLITTNLNAPSHIWLNDGHGTFSDGGQVGAGTYRLSVGDVNGDGKLDLVTANYVNSTVSVLLGNGDGTFTDSGQSLTVPAGRPISAGLGDINGDGNLDLVVAVESGPDHVFLNDGTGTFTDSAQLLGGFEGTRDVVLADLNGDAASLFADQMHTLNVLANDSDVNGNALAVSSVDTLSARGAVVTVNPDGTLNYNPTNATELLALHQGDIVVDHFSYTISDGHGGTDTALVSIRAVGVNDAPVTTPVTLAAIAEDSGARVITRAELLANATDVDGPALTAVNLAISTGNGTLDNNGDGTWTYHSAANDDTSVSFSYAASDGIAAPVATSASLDITPVNDAPTGGVTITGTPTEDQILTADTSTLADADGLGALHYVWQRSTDGGAGWTPSNVGSDQATYTLGDADVGAEIRVLVSYTDGGGRPEQLVGGPTAAIANVNDSPVLSNVSPTGSSTEQVLALLDSNASVSDVDFDALNGGAGDYAGAQLAILRNGGVNAEDLFSFDTSGASFSVVGNTLQSGGLIFATFNNTILGVPGGRTDILFTSSQTPATKALVNDVLQHITYADQSDTPPPSVQLLYAFDDGHIGVGQTKTVSITSVDDLPLLDLNGAGGGSDVTLNYTEQQAATPIAPGALVSDVDSTDFNGGAFKVAQTLSAGTDRLTIGNIGTAAGQISVSGNTVSYEGTEIGTFTGGTGGNDLVVSFDSASATAAAVQALARDIQYENGQGDNPSSIPRTFTFTLNDGDGGTSTPSVATVNIVRVNDAPVVTAGNTLNYTENQAATSISPAATATDADAVSFNGGSLTAHFSVNGTVADQLSIANVGVGAGEIGVTDSTVFYQGVAFGTFSGGSGGSDLLVTFLNSTAPTPAAVQALLQNIQFSNSSDDPSTATRTVTFTLNDGGNTGGPSMTGSDSASINITAVNDAPVTTPVTLAAIAEDSGPRVITQAELLANASDVDGPALTAVNLAISTGNGTLDNNGDGTWTYHPAANDDTSVSFSYAVSDGIAAPVATSASLDINAVNDAPVTTPVTLAAIAEDSGPRVITQAELLANASDVDGPALTAVNLAISTGNGTLDNNGDGTWTYHPAANDDTSVSFSYAVSDGIAAPVATSASLDITAVNATNNAPTITSNGGGDTASLSTAENATAVTTVTASDPDTGQTMGYAIVGGDDAAKFTIDVATGALAFVTAPNFEAPGDAGSNNVYDVTVQVSDGAGGIDTQAIAVTVTNVNDAPVTTPVTLAAIVEDSGPRVITQAELLANASDVDGPALTAVNLAISSGNGTLDNNGNGTWTYHPAANDDTSVTFSYAVSDGIAAPVATSAGLDITPVNDAPVTTPVTLAAIVEDSGPRVITQAELLANASDVDGPALTAVNLAISSGNGTLDNNGNGTWTYHPAANDDTSVTFSYAVSDGIAAPVATSASLDITPVNDAPVTTPVTLAAIAEDSGPRVITQAELLANASDVDGPALTAVNLAISSGNGTLDNNGNGTWTYHPAANDDTSVTFSFAVSDGIAAPVATSASLDITPVNDAPVTTPVTLAAIVEDSGPRVITQAELLANASDVDGPALTAVNLAISSGNGTLDNNGNGTWTYHPAANDDTSVTFSFAVSDGIAAPVATSASLDITPVNDAPVNNSPVAAEATIGNTTVFSAANGNGITVSDVDVNETAAPNNVLNLSLVVNTGTLTLGSTSGITIVAGANGGALITVSGTVAAINLALDGLAYTPTAAFNGQDQLTITTSDLGHTGGPSLTDIDIVALSQNIFTGTNNAETINGTTNADFINALGGDDTINALAGNDVVFGGDGNDTIRTGTGTNLNTDTVDGGAGNDDIHIESGTKLGAIAGGADNDHIFMETTAFSGSIDGGAGTDTLTVTSSFVNNFAGATFAGIETTLLSGPMTIDSAQAGNLGSIDLTATAASVNLTGAGTGVFGPAIVGNGETLTINANASVGGDVISFASGSQITGTGKVAFNGGSGDDSFTGTEFADTINGGAGNDTLIGGDGNDTISTGTGTNIYADTVDGGAGNDDIHIQIGTKLGAIAGGADNDHIFMETTAFSGSIDGGAGTDTLTVTSSFVNNFAGATFAGIETTLLSGPMTIDSAQAGNLGSIDLTATAASVNLTGAGTGVFGPAIVGNGETLTINANASVGGDVISFASGSQITGTGKVVFNGGSGDDSFTGTEFADTINGGAGNDTLIGGDGNDTISTGTGTNIYADTVDGGAGNDDIHIQIGTKLGAIAGGADNDHIFMETTAFSGSIDGGAGTDTLTVTSSFVNNFAGATFAGIETTLLSGPMTIDSAQAGNLGSIDLTATAASVNLTGAGTGVFGPAIVGNGETLTINANASVGGDVISFASGSQITGTGKVAFNGGSGDDSFTGTEFADTINGGAGNDTLIGGDGNDTISTGTGTNIYADTVDGGAGNDDIHIQIGTKLGAIAGGADNDHIFMETTAFSGSIDGGAGTDTLTVTSSFVNNFAGATFAGIETTLLSGPMTIDSAQAGNLGSIDLTATAASVNLTGAGTGVFGPAIVGNGETLTINANASVGGDVISFASGSQITGTGKVAFNGGSGDDSFTGTEFADTINGGAGNDTLIGGDGNDTISTGTGTNIYADTVDGGAGNDDIHIQIGTKLGTIAGGADNDHIFMETTAFSGSIDGGAGTDTLTVTSSFVNNFAGATFAGIETTLLSGPMTIDSAQAGNLGSIDLTATAASVNLTGAGTGVFGPAIVGNGETLTINANASVGGDVISFASGSQITGTGKVAFNGGSGDDSFTGTEFADTINGGAGNDRLGGGGGTDTLTGGTGNDTFVFKSPSDGMVTITDFAATDKLEVSAADFGGGLTQITDPASVFGTSANATFGSAAERFHYDTTANILYFDADGSGTNAAAVAIADFSNHAIIQANGLLIV